MRPPVLLSLSLLPLLLSGCTLTSSIPPSPSPAALVLQGTVHGGSQPVSGAHVYLLAANTKGYGGSGIAASTANASVSLLNAAETTHSDSLGAYVLSGTDGTFSIGGSYTACDSGSTTQVYLYALGGNTGSGTNSSSGLMAALGSCAALGSGTKVTINEVSTIAAAYSLAGFASDATHIASSGTALAQTGVTNAFATPSNLADLPSGTALSTTPANNGTAPQMALNTLANILASCVNSADITANGGAVTPSAACSTLFANTTVDGTPTGALPSDTASAAINLAHHPAANTATLYKTTAPSAPFSPGLTAVPNDFTLGLLFSSGLQGSEAVAIDGSGNIWVPSFEGNKVFEFSSTGTVLSTSTGYADGGVNEPASISIGTTGYVWITGEGAQTVTKLSSSGSVLNTTSQNGIVDTQGVAVDAQGNAWVADGNALNVIELNNAGTVISPTGGDTGAGSYPSAIAFDSSDNPWVVSSASSSVVRLSTTGHVMDTCSGGGLSESEAIALDSHGNAWVANDLAASSTIVEFSSTCTVLSGSTGYTGGGLNNPHAIAIDGSGNAWAANYGGSSITELSPQGSLLSGATGYQGVISQPDSLAIDGSGNLWMTSGGVSKNPNLVTEIVGAATPVITPLSSDVPGNTLGTRP